MKVSFIGLGRMGSVMAQRVLVAGHELTAYNRTASKVGQLVDRGARQAQTVAEAARAADVVVTMLENDAAVVNVALGTGGLVESMAGGAIHVAMGTHSVDVTGSLDQAHREAGQILVAAPVLGRPPTAAAGQLGIIAGGPPAAVETCRPLFEAMGRRTFDGGEQPVGAAAAKIANNLVLACAIGAMGEGFALAEKAGVAGVSFYEILTDGLFAAPAYKIYGKIIAEKNFFGEAGFTATTGLKDVNLALTAGEAWGVSLPSGKVCKNWLSSAIARGDGDRDWSVMALEQARASGLA